MPPLSKIKFVVPKELAKYVGKSVPREAKVMASRGTLPIPPKDLSIVLFYLAYDPDPEIKETAKKSLLNFPPPLLKTLLDSKEIHPLIIDFFARNLDPESGLLENIALNSVTHDQTIEFLASKPFKRLVEIIANNQTRLLRHPPIVDILGNNPMVGQATIDRILHFIKLETGVKKMEEEAPPPEEQPQEEAPPPEEGAEEYEDEIPDYMQDEEYPWTDEDEEVPEHWGMVDLPPELSEDHDEELSEDDHLNLTQRIAQMSISDKIKTAMLGNKEARSILIKDSNKIVASAVMSSPKLTDNEIESISKSRTVSEEVIRQIANNNEWSRSYNIKLNLVNNNKTPLQTSLKFLNFLTQRDITQVSKSKNVPGPIATAAKKLIQKRREGKKG